MANVFGKSGKRFCIDDAFEEESSESITTVNIYGATTERSPLKPKFKHKNLLNNEAVVDVDQNAPLEGFANANQHHIKHINEDTLSRDSDSFMHDGSGMYSNFFDRSQWCCYHPKVKDNWKTVLAAVVLLIIGTGLLLIGLIFVISPDPNLQGIVFIIAGLICFIPGSYHVVYIYFAVIGKDGSLLNDKTMNICSNDGVVGNAFYSFFLYVSYKVYAYSTLYTPINEPFKTVRTEH